MDPKTTSTDGRRTSVVSLVGRFVVLGGIVYLAVRLLSTQPSEVRVQFVLGPAAGSLRQLSARYVKVSNGEQMRRVRFDYDESAPSSQPHTVQLPDGEYRVELDLRYSKAAPATIGGKPSVLGGGGAAVHLTRPLIVDGSGGASVFIMPD